MTSQYQHKYDWCSVLYLSLSCSGFRPFSEPAYSTELHLCCSPDTLSRVHVSAMLRWLRYESAERSSSVCDPSHPVKPALPLLCFTKGLDLFQPFRLVLPSKYNIAQPHKENLHRVKVQSLKKPKFLPWLKSAWECPWDSSPSWKEQSAMNYSLYITFYSKWQLFHILGTNFTEKNIMRKPNKFSVPLCSWQIVIYFLPIS